MTPTPFVYGDFTIRREWRTTPEKIFRAWADPAVKAKWFGGSSDQWEVLRRSSDFRVGGVELEEGRFRKTGMVSLYQARIHFIEENARLVYAYDMWIDGAPLSTSLATVLLEPATGGAKFTYSEHLVFLDGKDGTASRIEGMEELFAAMEKVVLG